MTYTVTYGDDDKTIEFEDKEEAITCLRYMIDSGEVRDSDGKLWAIRLG